MTLQNIVNGVLLLSTIFALCFTLITLFRIKDLMPKNWQIVAMDVLKLAPQPNEFVLVVFRDEIDERQLKLFREMMHKSMLRYNMNFPCAVITAPKGIEVSTVDAKQFINLEQIKPIGGEQ